MNRVRTFKILVFAMIFMAFIEGAWAQEKGQDFLNHQGRKLMEAGQYLQAAEAYKQAIRLEPGLELAYLGLKKAYKSLTYWEQVKEAHRLLEGLAPDDAVGHYGLGLLYVLKKDMGYAQDEYLILEKLDPALAQRLNQAIQQRR